MSAAAPVSAQLPRPGDMIAGKYVLDRLLGQGGMGAVFAARHVKLSKAVAIKIMLADASNQEARERFINEGRAAANIQNEHVVRVDDVDEELGYAYMVLELLDGEDLSQVLEKEPTHRLAPPVAVRYVVEGLRGVIQAHQIGIVHRDLKPSNLFLARRKDGSIVVKVLDFGISKAQGSSALAASPNALTSTKAMLGSPLYMSPEQLRSSKSVDHRADIWAMGVILYELMTGALPFMGDNLGELFANILETDPVPLSQRTPGVPPQLEAVVLRCLARKPEQRFQTANELHDALMPFVGQQLGAIPGYTPSVSGPIVPTTQAITGSGPRPIPQQPTAPLGAVTPVGMHQTNTGWQTTGNGTNIGIPTKSKTPLILAFVGFAMLAIAGVTFMIVTRMGAKPHDAQLDPNASASTVVATAAPPSASSTPVADSVTPPPPVSATASADPTPTPPPPSATTAPTAKPTATGQHHHTTPGPVVKVEPKPVEPKPTAEPAPKPTTKPTANSSGGLQNNR